MDLTRLQQRLQPKPDGESAVRHRTGTVNTVNSDGTVDLDLGGVVVPDVSVLDGAFIETGDVVQVVAWAGDLLVLGTVALSAAGVGWTTWTPTLTNITTTSGTLVARYQQVVNTVNVWFVFTLGASSAVGTGPQVSLPVPCHASYGDNKVNIGTATLFEAGVARRLGTVIVNNTTQRFVLEALDVSTTVRHIAITSTVPFTWGTGDSIGFQVSYEAG